MHLCSECVTTKEKKAAFYLDKVIALLRECAEYGRVYDTAELNRVLGMLRSKEA